MNNLTKNLVLWLVIAMVLMAVFNNFAPEQSRSGQEIDYSMFLDEVERGSVEQVTIDGSAIYIRARNG
ncbi:MAG: ATP-dependent metalloprotease, partial [Proteobacteria bacterium]|nr:ATP-dependent metalloprotease [Pseudomonadota bacterium]